jgi:hypothetical protein
MDTTESTVTLYRKDRYFGFLDLDEITYQVKEACLYQEDGTILQAPAFSYAVTEHKVPLPVPEIRKNAK